MLVLHRGRHWCGDRRQWFRVCELGISNLRRRVRRAWPTECDEYNTNDLESLGLREAVNAMEVPKGMRVEAARRQKPHDWHLVHFLVREGL